MITIFVYRFKALMKNRELIFWVMLFPILLVTLFNMAFSNFGEFNIIGTIEIGIVDNPAQPSHLVQVMEMVEVGDENLFALNNLSYEEGRELLADNEVAGLIKIHEDGEFELIINRNNIPQTILRQFLDNYKQQTTLIQSQIQMNPEIVYTGWLESIGEFENYVEQLYVSSNANDIMIVAYYTAIAMTALYGAMLAAEGMRTIFARRSKVAARVHLSPYPKTKLILADFASCTLIILVSQILLILYMNYVIGIAFTSQLGAIALIIFLGSVLATSFGYMFVLLTKSDGYITGITMLWCFLAGMMGPQIKVAVESAVPYINFVNPVAL
ncbi:MAG: ABC transporter permease, partial [Oscillospiraceae bacterium]|nr:ABC transporter permease [Oscillospiraceae bacterium]